jgi:SpoVK/Ycf46/Vps4 family AAA+-type ATPase
MLALHLEGRPVAAGFNLLALASSLECYSASDIRFLVDEAARDALKKRQDITDESFRTAMSRVQPSVPAEVEAQYRSIEQRGL